MNLLAYQSELDIRGKYVFDPIRMKDIVITPEELVRQLLILYLIKEKQFPKNKISVERQVLVNGRPKRFDILVYSEGQTAPIFLIECKAPNVKIDEAVLFQISNYNKTLRAKYCLITNGMSFLCSFINLETEEIRHLEDIPSYSELHVQK